MSSTNATAFQLHYRKHKYTPDTIEQALLYDIQNYIPIYSRFFDLNDTNYNGIQLNQMYYLQNITYKILYRIHRRLWRVTVRTTATATFAL